MTRGNAAFDGSLRDLPAAVDIREVGPRDGLQPEVPVAESDRVRLVHALLAAGVHHVEVAAFVSPRAVPAMAGAEEVVAGVQAPPSATVAALVPNRRGAESALAAGVGELTVTISVSEAYNQRNVGMSTAQSEKAIAEIARLATGARVSVDAVISCAFGSPYEGDIDPGTVAALGDRLRASGCAAVTYADTTGMATPRRVDDLLAHTGPGVGLHLHDTRGTALVNAFAALEDGVTRFDTSVGGLGGSPFAHGAAGNLATEELVAVLDDCGIRTGIDIDALLEAASLAADLVGHVLPSRLATVGPRSHQATTAREG